MESFQDFLTHMSAQLPEHFFSGMPDEHADAHGMMRAAYLGSLLQLIHDDLNALCRRNPDGVLGPMSIQAINKALVEVQGLLGQERQPPAADLLDETNPPMHADALELVSTYRDALRSFPVL